MRLSLSTPGMLASHQQVSPLMLSRQAQQMSASAGAVAVMPSDQVSFTQGTASPDRLFSPAHIQQIRFGEQQTLKDKTVVFYSGQIRTPHFNPAGLGIVTDIIPSNLNKFHGANVMVMGVGFDYLVKPKGEKDPEWQNTGIKFSLPIPWVDPKTKRGIEGVEVDPVSGTETLKLSQSQYPKPEATFELYQKHNKDLDTYFYAVRTEDPLVVGLNGKPKGMSDYTQLANAYGKGLTNTEAMIWSYFSHAMAHATRYLDPTKYKPEPGQTLQQSKGPIDALLTNDWHTGTVKTWLEKSHPDMKHTPNVFMVHNQFDKPIGNTELFENPGFSSTPEGRQLRFWARRTGFLPDSISPLDTAIRKADAIIINDNYYNELTQSDFLDQRKMHYLKRALAQHKGTHFDMVHGYKSEIDPTGEFLKKAGGKQYAVTDADKQAAEKNKTLNAKLPEEKRLPEDPEKVALMRFKAENKQILQKHLGFKEDPGMVIFHTTARWDRSQKMADLVMETVPELLKKNPKVAFVFDANLPDHDPRLLKFLYEAQRDYPGRIHATSKFDPPLEALLEAGGDFSINLSQYEPYGQANLGSMLNGNIPLVNYVGGFASASSDPAKGKGKPGYGQTAIIMDPVLLPHETEPIVEHLGNESTESGFRQKLKEFQAAAPGTKEEGVWQQYQRALTSVKGAFNEALAMVDNKSKHADVMAETRRFVLKEHDWKIIVGRYIPPVNKAIEVSQARQAEEAQFG